MTLDLCGKPITSDPEPPDPPRAPRRSEAAAAQNELARELFPYAACDL
jgi:hypothetical protein